MCYNPTLKYEKEVFDASILYEMQNKEGNE